MYRVIFEHHVKQDMEEAFIDQWQAGSDIIQTYTGARGTLLFKSTSEHNVFYAMAEWENEEARINAMAEIEKRDDAEFILRAHEQYVDQHSVVASGELVATSIPVKEN